MTALPAEQVTRLEPAPAVTLTTDQARAILNALEQLEDFAGLSAGQSKARQAIRQQVGGGH